MSNPYLDNFYKDPKRWALEMQLWLLKQRFNTFVEALRFVSQTGTGVILDRSIFSDWVFAEKNRLDGNISEEGFAAYAQLRQRMLDLLPLPTAMVYLDVSAEECYRRVHHMRCRTSESGIPLEYLAGLSDCYQSFVGDMKSFGVSSLVVPWNNFGSSDEVASSLQSIVGQAKEPWLQAIRMRVSSPEWADAVRHIIDSSSSDIPLASPDIEMDLVNKENTIPASYASDEEKTSSGTEQPGNDSFEEEDGVVVSPKPARWEVLA